MSQSMPAVYKIEMNHGEFTWLVKKKEKHFQDLHRDLKTYKAVLNLPLPTRRSVASTFDIFHKFHYFTP